MTSRDRRGLASGPSRRLVCALLGALALLALAAAGPVARPSSALLAAPVPAVLGAAHGSAGMHKAVLVHATGQPAQPGRWLGTAPGAASEQLLGAALVALLVVGRARLAPAFPRPVPGLPPRRGPPRPAFSRSIHG